MKKPHEEWSEHAMKPGYIMDTTPGRSGGAVCIVQGLDRKDVAAKTRRLLALPDMEQALADALDALGKAQDALEHAPIRGLADARDAVEAVLRKAGVIP